MITTLCKKGSHSIPLRVGNVSPKYRNSRLQKYRRKSTQAAGSVQYSCNNISYGAPTQETVDIHIHACEQRTSSTHDAQYNYMVDIMHGTKAIRALHGATSRGVVGRGRVGTASPTFFDRGTRPPLPHFFGLKFVQKLVHCGYLLKRSVR